VTSPTALNAQSRQAQQDDSEKTTVFAAILPKTESESFACYWLLLDTTEAEPGQSRYGHALKAVLNEILVDPLLERLAFYSLNEINSFARELKATGCHTLAIKQFMPGVTDNTAHIVEEAIAMKNLPFAVKVASGRGYLSKIKTDEFADAQYRLYHPLVEKFLVRELSEGSFSDFLSFPQVQLSEPKKPEAICLQVSDAELVQISKTRLLALTLEEMQAIKNHFAEDSKKAERKKLGLPEAPTDVELEVIAQTWSEHCKHKIFNAQINFVSKDKEGVKQTQKIESLYKSFIQKVTKELTAKRPDLLSVFVDNSGVVKWDEQTAVCFKVETHNSPSALEPYGGALTGILGVNRDVLGTGLGAAPLFNTDVLCFAHPDKALPVRPKLLPPETIINGVRKGIQDGGNKSGIPTVNGAIMFDPDYRAKPLVFCGTGGLLPLEVNGLSGYGKHTKNGDLIVMAGGRVGKDGVHGATFSSEALHEGSPVTAVQIGDPFTQKRLIDFVLAARDQGLISGITDNGAGGLSSSVGEMAELTGGASMALDHIPTKYPGLSDWELVVSESQERMTISTTQFDKLKILADKYHVEVSAIGEFTQSGKFEISRAKKLICSLDLHFLHKGCPTLILDAEEREETVSVNQDEKPGLDAKTLLLKLLSHPNIANREVVVRQYDHEVQAKSVIKPLMGPRQNAPCDAAVITPIAGQKAGLAVANGLAPRLSKRDAYLMAVCAVDEAVRNAVCVGADPQTISLLDNFCWPDPVESATNQNGRSNLAKLVKACQGLYDACKVFEAPLISGKDSMKNDFDDGVVRLSVPPTLLVSLLARVPDVEFSLSMEFKTPGDLIYLLHAGKAGFATSHVEELFGWQTNDLPSLDLSRAKHAYQILHQQIRKGLVKSAHDLSEGGLAVALAECSIGSGLGAKISLSKLIENEKGRHAEESILFAEGPGLIVLSIDQAKREEFEKSFGADKTNGALLLSLLGTVTASPDLQISGHDEGENLISLSVEELEKYWNTALPFN
jgi:phosphoribosylformylglycinamidine synthase